MEAIIFYGTFILIGIGIILAITALIALVIKWIFKK